ncbi:MAG: hypothetical protein MHM6MM_009328 [Cercozoa sp. M6MM]
MATNPDMGPPPHRYYPASHSRTSVPTSGQSDGHYVMKSNGVDVRMVIDHSGGSPSPNEVCVDSMCDKTQFVEALDVVERLLEDKLAGTSAFYGTFDVQEAYFQFPLSQRDAPFLGFAIKFHRDEEPCPEVEGDWQLRVMSMGHKISMGKLAQFLQPVAAHIEKRLGTSVLWMADNFAVKEVRPGTWRKAHDIVQHELGIVLKPEDDFPPQRVFDFVGANYDTLTGEVWTREGKASKFIQQCDDLASGHRAQIALREMQQFAGRSGWRSRVYGVGKSFLRDAHHAANSVPRNAKPFWKRNVTSGVRDAARFMRQVEQRAQDQHHNAFELHENSAIALRGLRRLDRRRAAQ